MTIKTFYTTLSAVLIIVSSFGQAKTIKLSTSEKDYDLTNATLAPYAGDGISGVQLTTPNQRSGAAWLKGKTFTEGVIEFDVMGANNPGASFVGIAFHAQNDSTYDCIYFRPFNFVAPKQENRDHMVQYISMPGNDWYTLREKRTGEFEKEIKNAPNPDKWFHARIEVKGDAIRVFVNHDPTPALVVNKLNAHHNGKIGLWVGSNSFGRFANLKF
jgi:hypothetical protein